MFPLFETIRVEGGRPFHLEYHNDRMNRSRRELYGPIAPLDLARVVVAPARADSGVLRCRVTYGESIGEVTFTPYRPRVVRTLTVVDGGGLRYPHKFADRSAIERLTAGVAGDDILIALDGFITDASNANVAFHDGRSWITPSRPLLPGTTRARLLDSGLLTAGEVRVSDLGGFAAAALMNAMIGFDIAHPVPIGAIDRT